MKETKIQCKQTCLRLTVNDKSLEWLKFGGFGELIKFAKLLSTNLL